LYEYIKTFSSSLGSYSYSVWTENFALILTKMLQIRQDLVNIDVVHI